MFIASVKHIFGVLTNPLIINNRCIIFINFDKNSFYSHTILLSTIYYYFFQIKNLKMTDIKNFEQNYSKLMLL